MIYLRYRPHEPFRLSEIGGMNMVNCLIHPDHQAHLWSGHGHFGTGTFTVGWCGKEEDLPHRFSFGACAAFEGGCYGEFVGDLEEFKERVTERINEKDQEV